MLKFPHTAHYVSTQVPLHTILLSLPTRFISRTKGSHKTQTKDLMVSSDLWNAVTQQPALEQCSGIKLPDQLGPILTSLEHCTSLAQLVQ